MSSFNTSNIAEPPILLSIALAMATILAATLFFVVVLPRIRAFLLVRENERQIVFYRQRIISALLRLAMNETDLDPVAKLSLLTEIRRNPFDDWGDVYLYDNCETSIDLPRSVWFVLIWLFLRRSKKLGPILRQLETGDFALLSIQDRLRKLRDVPELPDIIRYGHPFVLDAPTRRHFPEITDDLLSYRECLKKRNRTN